MYELRCPTCAGCPASPLKSEAHRRRPKLPPAARAAIWENHRRPAAIHLSASVSADWIPATVLALIHRFMEQGSNY